MKYFFLILALFFVSCTNEGDPIIIPSIPTEVDEQHKTIVKATSIYPADSPAGAFLEEFALQLSELSQGSIDVVVYHGGFLGDAELADDLSEGHIDFALLPPSEDDPLFKIMSQPFLLNRDQMDRFLSFLRIDEIGLTDTHVLTYINGGTIGLSTEARAESMSQLFAISDPQRLDELLIPIEWEPANAYQSDYPYRYYADIELGYDLLLFHQSPNSHIDFADQQLVVTAVEAAQSHIENIEQYEIGMYENLVVYQPDDYLTFLETSSLEQFFTEGFILPDYVMEILE